MCKISKLAIDTIKNVNIYEGGAYNIKIINECNISWYWWCFKSMEEKME